MYFKSMKIAQENLKDWGRIERIVKFFKDNKSIIIKLNHCLSDSDSGTNQYDAYMQLGDDGDFMRIVKKVPLKKMFVQSANDRLIQTEKAKCK